LAVGQVVGQAIRHAPRARPPHQLHLLLGETTATGGCGGSLAHDAYGPILPVPTPRLATGAACDEMAPMAFHETATRLWKGLPAGERLLAAAAFYRDPSPELVGSALGVIAKARRMRPQAARSLPPDAQARILGTVLDPGESLAQGLLVALHLNERRALLAAFLDALDLPHEEGILTEEADGTEPPSVESAQAARAALGTFSPDQVETYLNTLWLQDAELWAALPATSPQ